MPNKKYWRINIVYIYVTITVEKYLQSAETHAGQEKKKFNNVDIMSASWLKFAAETGYFSTLAPL